MEFDFLKRFQGKHPVPVLSSWCPPGVLLVSSWRPPGRFQIQNQKRFPPFPEISLCRLISLYIILGELPGNNRRRIHSFLLPENNPKTFSGEQAFAFGFLLRHCHLSIVDLRSSLVVGYRRTNAPFPVIMYSIMSWCRSARFGCHKIFPPINSTQLDSLGSTLRRSTRLCFYLRSLDTRSTIQ